MSPFPRSGGVHLFSVELTCNSGWGHSSLYVFWGEVSLFSQGAPTHLSILPWLWVPPTAPLLHSHLGFQPRVPPACSEPSPPAPHPCPFPPPSWVQGLSLLPPLGNCCLPPFPDKNWVTVPPKMTSALMEPRGHCHGQALGTALRGCSVQTRVPGAGDIVPVPPCQCSDSGDTLRLEGTWGVQHCLELVTCAGWRGHQISPGRAAWGHPPLGTDEDTAVW